MSEESKSTEEGQVATEGIATETPTGAETSQPEGTGMIGVQPDGEIEATDTSQDIPMESFETPLFDEVAPTEAELSGEEVSSKEEGKPSGTEEPAATSQPTDEKPESKEEPESSPPEKPQDEKPPEDGKPPAGYVPHAALHETRMLNQELRQGLADLRQELADIKTKGESPSEEAFKVLSDKEFDDFAEDDPVEAVKYQRQLDKHLREQDAEKTKQKAGESQYHQDQAIISQSLERMQKAVPGLHEEGNPVNQQLSNFAIENGFDPDYLTAMTAPGTLILPTGAKNAVLLGDGAAGLVEMIHKVHSALKANNSDVLRAEIEKELIPKITEQLMKKFKSPTGNLEFKSIGEVPGASDEIPSTSGGITEAQYANMSLQDREKLLGA